MDESGTGTVEERATRMGWVPKEDFRGDPDKWVAPEVFISRAENQLPILKGTLSTMERKMIEQEQLIKQQAGKLDTVHDDMKKFVEFSRKAEERAYTRALADLKAEQAQAFEEQDKDKFNKVTQQIEELKPPEPVIDTGVPATPTNQWYSKEVEQNWIAENDWFLKDPDMYGYSNQMDNFFKITEPNLSQVARLAKITEQVKKKFPDYFNPQNPNRNKPPAVEGAEHSAPSGNSGKHTYNDLPPEAKKMCDEWTGKDGKGTGTITGFTREEYLKQYQWD